MAPKKGLGRGLNQLIPTNGEADKPTVKTKTVTKEVIKEVVKEVEKKLKLSEIEPNRTQPRKVFNEDALNELADSIKQYGVIEPIVVVKRDDYYEIIAGERRWRAARIAGLTEVPVIIKDYTEQEIVEIALIENLQREDLNPIEEALAYQRLIDEFNLKQEEVAEKVSKSRSTITNSIRLLKLDKKVQSMLIEDMISAGHARCLISIEDLDKQYDIAMQIFEKKLSVRETEKLIKNLLNKKPETDAKTTEADDANAFIYKDIEENLKNILGTKISIKAKNNKKGKIEIDYYSPDDLDRIIHILYGSENN